MESKIKLPKLGDEIYARWNNSMQWTTSIFIGETENGFEVYNFCIEDSKHIEFYEQITFEPHYENNIIFYSKKFKGRNYSNYNFIKNN
jgi:hypothetical protein